MNNKKRLINQVQKNYIESIASGYRIAKDTGLSPDTVYAFLRGERFLDIDKLETICNYLKISLVEFFAMDDNDNETNTHTGQASPTHHQKK